MSTTTLDILEARSLAKLVGDIDWDRLTDEYLDGPDGPREGWTYLARHISTQVFHIERRVLVRQVDLPDPYVSERHQRADIAAGRFNVSRLHCEHPLWTPSENVSFRIWHDVDGHDQLHAPFDRHGEVLVFWHHANQLRNELSIGTEADRLQAIDALFSESIYQLAHCISTGYFAKQRAVRLGRYGRVVRDAIRLVFPELLEIGPRP